MALLRGRRAGTLDRLAVGKESDGRGIRSPPVVPDAPVEQQDDPDDVDREKGGFDHLIIKPRTGYIPRPQSDKS